MRSSCGSQTTRAHTSLLAYSSLKLCQKCLPLQREREGRLQGAAACVAVSGHRQMLVA